MKRRLTIRVLATLTAVLLITFTAVTAVYAAGNFYITDYDIRMVVREDDTYEITETINVTFTEASHGVYRTIPGRTKIERDGQTSRYNAKVYDFEVLSGQPFEAGMENGKYIFKIGDPDYFADTETQYQIRYIYDTGGDHFKGADEVYHNLIGREWEAQHIDHVSFEIVFPKDVDAGKIGIKTGNQEYVPFEAVDPRTIRGETGADVLGGLTVRAQLPEGYFTREAEVKTLPLWIMSGILALIAAVGALLWKRFGIDPVYPVTPEFYPPEGLSAPEAAYLSKGSLASSDVVSLLLELADKGYLKIRDCGDDTYDISLVRECDADITGARTFMTGLFATGNTVNTRDLENSFYTTISDVENAVKNKYAGRLYDRKARSVSKGLKTAGLIGTAGLSLVTIITGDGYLLENIWMLLLPVILISIGGSFITYSLSGKVMKIIGAVILIIGWVVIAVSGIISGARLLPFTVGYLIAVLIMLISGMCEKKTDFYASILAKIEGYKDFLMTAEKDKINAVADSDPAYFYHTLAFAFALGISSVYAKRFISIADRVSPDWYDHRYYDDDYDSDRMFNSIDRMVSKTGSSMTSCPSSDSDGGGGGGSFSGGGGGGGGGGGSW